MEDDVVGHQVDEHRRLDGDREVAPILLIGDPGQAFEPGSAVDRESGYLRTEFGAETDIGLGGHPLGELGQHVDEFGVDRAAVVALHEVLDDQLPVRRHVVDDAVADVEAADAIAVDGIGVAEAS